MIKPTGLIILILAVLLGGYTFYGGGCNNQMLLGPSLPQEAGDYFLVDGSWEVVTDDNFSDDVAYGVKISLDDFNNDVVSLKSGSKLEWYAKYTPAMLSYLNSGLFGALTQADMASAQVVPLVEYNVNIGQEAMLCSEGIPVAEVISDKSDLNKGYTWYEFSAIPPGKYVILFGNFVPTPIGCIVVN